MADIEKFVYYSNGSKKVLKPIDYKWLKTEMEKL